MASNSIQDFNALMGDPEAQKRMKAHREELEAEWASLVEAGRAAGLSDAEIQAHINSIVAEVQG